MYDIHGNLPALEAALDEVGRLDVDLVVVGGDVVWGPFPRETLDLLQGLGSRAAFIRGNADREVAGRFSTKQGLDEVTAEITTWCADELTVQQMSWLRDLPATLALKIDHLGDVLFCHGSPRSDEESLTPLTPVDRLRSALSGVMESIVVCGHTHMQFERAIEGHRVINAGSIGMAYQSESGAYWALLGPSAVELRRTTYDTNATVEAMRSTRCPHVEEVFIDVLINPPAPGDVARQFEAASKVRSVGGERGVPGHFP